jgi:hypothetical protein
VEDRAHALDLVGLAAGEDLRRVPRGGLPAQLDPDYEPVARAAVEVDHDGVGWIGGKRLQLGRARGRNDLDLFGERLQTLGRAGSVRRPGDQNDAQAERA